MENEKRLIDANALLDRMSFVTNDTTCPLHIAACIDQEIELAPTVDAVEVVRCKECKHCAVASWGERYCARSRFVQLDDLNEDDFCSYGERRTDNA